MDTVTRPSFADLGKAFPAVFKNDATLNDSRHTFCFVGGGHVSGSLETMRGGFRNYPGLFEECVRGYWNYPFVSNFYARSNYFHRYVFDHSYAGCCLSDVLSEWGRVEAVDPETLVYLVGPEDYANGDDGLPEFASCLEDLIVRALGLRKGRGHLAIQKHWCVADADAEANIAKYNAAVDKAARVAALRGLPIERMIIVDHHAQTAPGATDYLGRDFLTRDLLPDGSLNIYGHSEIGRQFAQSAYGDSMASLLNPDGPFAGYVLPEGYAEDADISWGETCAFGLNPPAPIDFAQQSQPIVWAPDGGSSLVSSAPVAWVMPDGFFGQVKGHVGCGTPHVSVPERGVLRVLAPQEAGFGPFRWRLLIRTATGPVYADGGAASSPFTIFGLPPAGKWRLKVFTEDGRQLRAVYGDMGSGSGGAAALLRRDGMSPFARAVQERAAAKKNAGLTWVAVGDSIVHACAVGLGWDGATQQFVRSLREDFGRPKDVFVNLAVSGSATAEEIHYRTARHGAYVPEVLILAVGVNDLARDITDGSPFSGTNVAGVAANYRKIVAAVRAKNPRVAIMIDSVLPENTGNLRHGTVAGLNARLRSLAEELNEPDSPIHFNDLCGQLENGVLPSRPYYMSRGSAHFYAVDELHVRPEGQNWRACRWLDAFGFDVADAQPQYTSWVALKRRQGEKNAVVFGDQLTGRLHVGLTPLRAANPGIGSVLVRVTDLTTRNVWSKTANVSSGGSENALEFDLRHVAEHPLRVECLGFGSAADDVAVYAFDAFAGSLADGRFRPE